MFAENFVKANLYSADSFDKIYVYYFNKKAPPGFRKGFYIMVYVMLKCINACLPVPYYKYNNRGMHIFERMLTYYLTNLYYYFTNVRGKL